MNARKVGALRDMLFMVKTLSGRKGFATRSEIMDCYEQAATLKQIRNLLNLLTDAGFLSRIELPDPQYNLTQKAFDYATYVDDRKTHRYLQYRQVPNGQDSFREIWLTELNWSMRAAGTVQAKKIEIEIYAGRTTENVRR